jgi:hypothetical protein
VEALQSEVEQHKRTERALRASDERVDLALDASGIGRWDLELLPPISRLPSRLTVPQLPPV